MEMLMLLFPKMAALQRLCFLAQTEALYAMCATRIRKFLPIYTDFLFGDMIFC